MTKRRGLILVAVMWILFILALLAMGLSWVGSGELTLLKLASGKLRAYAAARAGIVYAQAQLVRRPASSDVLGRVGIDVDVQGEKRIVLEDLRIGDQERFDIGVPAGYYVDRPGMKFLPGLSDEMGRFDINLVNAADSVGACVLEQLIERLQPGAGAGIREAVVKYKKSSGDEAVTRVFFFPEELLMLEGMTVELFRRLKPFITVYPLHPQVLLKVNMYTAPKEVVRAVFQGIAVFDKSGIETTPDADEFLRCRSEGLPDGEGKENKVDRCALPSYLSAYDQLGPFHSGLYRIRSVGTDLDSGRRAVVEAVIESGSDPAKVLSWHRE
jgi:hypothetical protein